MAKQTKNILNIEVTSMSQSLDQFKDAFQRAEHGDDVETYSGIGFESMSELLAVFTPKRWELIEVLKQNGPCSINALAKMLGRNYKNVHTDVKALMVLDVIQVDEGKKISIPWDEIDVRWPLAA